MDWVVFSLIAIPVGTAVLLLGVPYSQKQIVRYIAAVSGGAQFLLSLIVFVKYQADDGGLKYDLRIDWLENIVFLQDNGISLHLAVDGISAPLVLLTGIVILAGVFISWNI
ncbi:MAG TPA: hypothetical protein VNL15_02140, partial [Dehalococcoidia bacterium]|nr:hypothetical protein [Dehalococcoidia bacterium]